MTTRETITVEELVARMADALSTSLHGDWLCQMANLILDEEYTYLGDDIVEVDNEPMP